MNADAEHWRALVAGFFGGVFFALIHLSAALLNGQPPSRQDIFRAAANVLIAILAGGIAAYFLTGTLVTIVPLASLRNPEAVAFVIGALAWVIAPVAIDLAQKVATKKAGEIG